MDTTKKYIKMCEAAKEIQNQWKPDVGDWFLNDFRGTTGFNKDVEQQIWGDSNDKCEKIQCLTYKPSIKEYVTVSDSDGSHTYTMSMSDFFKHRHVFLPRQDQLQDMLKRSHTMGAIIEELYEFYLPERFCLNEGEEYRTCKCEEIGIKRRKTFDSIEQLWLAIVMRERHKKEWDGIGWKDA